MGQSYSVNEGPSLSLPLSSTSNCMTLCPIPKGLGFLSCQLMVNQMGKCLTTNDARFLGKSKIDRPSRMVTLPQR